MTPLPLLAMLVAAQDVPPPRGVNDSILGTAEQFRVRGPARVCLMGTSVDLRLGENAYLEYLGIHWGGLRIVRGDGTYYLVREGSWAEPQRPRLEEDWRGRTIARSRREGHPAFLIYAPDFDNPSREHPSVWVLGDALGRSNNRDILDRIIVHSDRPAGCQRRFTYGWDSLGRPEQDQ